MKEVKGWYEVGLKLAKGSLGLVEERLRDTSYMVSNLFGDFVAQGFQRNCEVEEAPLCGF